MYFISKFGLGKACVSQIKLHLNLNIIRHGSQGYFLILGCKFGLLGCKISLSAMVSYIVCEWVTYAYELCIWDCVREVLCCSREHTLDHNGLMLDKTYSNFRGVSQILTAAELITEFKGAVMKYKGLKTPLNRV